MDSLVLVTCSQLPNPLLLMVTCTQGNNASQRLAPTRGFARASVAKADADADAASAAVTAVRSVELGVIGIPPGG